MTRNGVLSVCTNMSVHDSWEALLWLKSTAYHLLSLDLSKVAVGGSSAGGNLAAVICHRALSAPSSVPKLRVKLLIVPVTDNTALPSNTPPWKENGFAPALPSLKILWYRNHYLPDEKTWPEPEASPLLYEGGWKYEGEAYAEKLESAGVEVELKAMKGMPHPFFAMDGVLQQGRDAITYMVEALNRAFA
ncbi:alpha/beta hydrolase fold-3 domain-containing protein [Drepanopeziza brunnea f. sp. 'multigermtubi' MB_m1]|uniref:Alpha/beta hydrolase fold-3 domain-containing protein n=1 Tax=Marssonina brunnea f. sp. multigermtubi (strain MB_m1) TaxID=1072389 RepID=K1X134_MARBU|nr:alpha/beta hydrolase fold-3 domain-containing protein [Drepanopeziza brunnea f. sp. 'multigermtubi' MB_m1]EKD18946.1 alpha/beta hydrolase fold-3 domain-containing protein [Drepanopeziza brunnea f. sp. 'multigermtubi' MB_m1]